MENLDKSSQEWVNREDTVSLRDRVNRLDWLISKVPDVEYWCFPGGQMAKSLFEETRYSFVYGQFLATIILGFAYIERTIAALIYEVGRNELERAKVSELLQKAKEYGWVSQGELDNLERARKIRNKVIHFRKPGHNESVEFKAATKNKPPYTIIEEDARHVIETVLHLLDKNVV